MRIAKYPPIFGIGFDKHGKMPPTSLTPPLPAVAGLIPDDLWLALIVSPISAEYLTGKWSKTSTSTEGMGAILWQHDWGPLQVHIPIKPPYLTPSIAILFLASSIKYWLPSFSVKEPIDGAAMAKAGGGDAPVAVSTPAWLISGQDCMDIACAKSYVAPTSVCFQAFSTRWVGFNAGDFIAGAIGMAGDALAALILSHFGGALMKGFLDNMLFGALAITTLGFLVNTIPAWATLGGSTAAFLAGFVRFMMTPQGVPGGYGFFAVAFAAPVAWVFGKTATAVGDTWGSKPEDAQPLPDSGAAGGPVGPTPGEPGGGGAGPGSAQAPDAGTPTPPEPSPQSTQSFTPADPPSSSEEGVCSPDDDPSNQQ